MPRGSRPTSTPRPPPSRFVEPNFLLPANPDVSDYRPVLNAEGRMVIFERNPTATPTDVKLYIADLSTGNVQRFVNFASARADWCWNRSGGGLTSGPVAFSNGDGTYRVDAGGQPVLLPNTAGMIYPSWYPDCQRLAVAGQFNAESNYYNQDLNYTWVTDRSTTPPTVAQMDRNAPRGAAFLQKFQARAGWWSPDGKWFAFESNRICNDISGNTYAIFIQDAAGARPAIQVSDCTWNVQHPKWFPPGNNGKTLLIAVVQAGPMEPFRIASFDVSRLLGSR